MSGPIGIFEAKTKFSELCEQVARTGKEIVVTRRGKRLVRIAPVCEITSQGEGTPAGVLERLRLRDNESLYGKTNHIKHDFPDAWNKRVSKDRSPLADE